MIWNNLPPPATIPLAKHVNDEYFFGSDSGVDQTESHKNSGCFLHTKTITAANRHPAHHYPRYFVIILIER